ncbi:MAG: endolytic transglycosylase MltG, partial [Actinomycetota bacterium]|nr:endolytic transglycosylase MltG [Actinomycetota bacterium]
MTESEATTSTEGRSKRPLFVAVGVVVAIIALVLVARFLAAAVAGDQALDVEPGIAVVVEIQAGSSAREIAGAMEQAGVVRAGELRAVIAEQGVASQLQAGTYFLETLMTPEAVAERLLTGPDTPTGSGIIVYEGHDVRRILAGLAAETGYPVADFEEALTSGAVTSPLLPADLPEGVDELTRWEGLLFPARYEMPEDATPAE